MIAPYFWEGQVRPKSSGVYVMSVLLFRLIKYPSGYKRTLDWAGVILSRSPHKIKIIFFFHLKKKREQQNTLHLSAPPTKTSKDQNTSYVTQRTFACFQILKESKRTRNLHKIPVQRIFTKKTNKTLQT
jgi:hypothetical protein